MEGWVRMSRRKMWFVIVPVLLFAMLTVCLRAGITVHFEGWAYSEAVEEMSPALTAVMRFITHMGDSVTVTLFCLALFIAPKPRKTIALPVSTAVISSAVLNFILKNLFTRERPDILRLINETGYSFPSGHAMINASLYTMLILLIFKHVESTSKKAVLTAICVILTVLIGYSRVYLGVHYADDVLGGWLFGFAVSMSVYFVWDSKLPGKGRKPA